MTEFSIRDAFKALEEVEENIEVKPVAKKHKTVNESVENKLVEQPMLEPEYDSRKSFYGKADVKEENGDKVLYSYGTPVCKITKDNKVELLSGSLPQTRGYKVALWRYSQTTLRHVKEFLKQNGFKAESATQMEKDYAHVEESCTKCNEEDACIKTTKEEQKFDASKNESCRGKKRKIKESTEVNLGDDKEVEKGKEELKASEEKDDNNEQIVDVDAETVDELKDSYIGNVILQCPVCRTLIYKKPDAIDKSEDNDKIYNVNEECPHCGSKDGFELVGQVASLGVEQDEPEATTGAPDEDEIKVDAIEEPKEDETTTEPKEDENTEEDELDLELESFDEGRFDKLVNKYVHSIYENVKEYKTVDGSVNDSKNEIVVEGKISYNDGKEVNTKFIFEAVSMSKDGSLKLKGLNETFTKAKRPFTMYGKINDKELVCESLNYNYKVKVLNEDRKVKGKVFIRNKSK